MVCCVGVNSLSCSMRTPVKIKALGVEFVNFLDVSLGVQRSEDCYIWIIQVYTSNSLN